MSWVNNAAHVTGKGNLVLGIEVDDLAGDATHGWAKGDIWVPMSAGQLISDTQPALTRIGAGSYKRTLVASTTHNVMIPLDAAMLRTFSGAPVAAAPHGVKVLSVALSYRVNTNPLTSLSLLVYTQAMAAAAAVPAPVALTTTTAGNTLTNAANQYLAVTTVTTPAFVNTLDTLFIAEAVIVTPASCTCDLLGASWRLAVALY